MQKETKSSTVFLSGKEDYTTAKIRFALYCAIKQKFSPKEGENSVD